MKSFIEFLREDTEPDITTTSYSDKATGVNSYFHYNNKTGNAYWGYQVPDGNGGHTDLPPEGLSPETKSAMSRASRDHLTRYMTDNPGINVTYQTHAGARGDANHNYYQKFVSKLRETNPEIGLFTRVTPTSSTKPGLGLGGKLGIAGAALALATGANAADLLHGLHPLSVLDGGSLGTDDVLPYQSEEEFDASHPWEAEKRKKQDKENEEAKLQWEKDHPPEPIEAAEPKPLSKPIPKNYSY